jgi:glucoamylase
MLPEQVWDTDPLPGRSLALGRPTGSAMPLAWAHAEFVKLLASRQAGHPFDRPRAAWQRYRGQKAAAQYAFWWPHAAIGGFAAGVRLVIALQEPALVRWGRDGWQLIEDTPTIDTGLGFHVAVLATSDLATGSRVDFTWRSAASGEWAGSDVTVHVAARAT